jgi:hypothetical protein
MDDRQFDSWTRDLAVDGPSRRRVIAGVAGFSLAALGMTRAADDVAAGCNGNYCNGDVETCRGNCVCYKRVGGGSVCAQDKGKCPVSECQNDRDCPRDHVCVKSGRKCCRGQRTACAKRC